MTRILQTQTVALDVDGLICCPIGRYFGYPKQFHLRELKRAGDSLPFRVAFAIRLRVCRESDKIVRTEPLSSCLDIRLNIDRFRPGDTQSAAKPIQSRLFLQLHLGAVRSCFHTSEPMLGHAGARKIDGHQERLVLTSVRSGSINKTLEPFGL